MNATSIHPAKEEPQDDRLWVIVDREGKFARTRIAGSSHRKVLTFKSLPGIENFLKFRRESGKDNGRRMVITSFLRRELESLTRGKLHTMPDIKIIEDLGDDGEINDCNELGKLIEKPTMLAGLSPMGITLVSSESRTVRKSNGNGNNNTDNFPLIGRDLRFWQIEEQCGQTADAFDCVVPAEDDPDDIDLINDIGPVDDIEIIDVGQCQGTSKVGDSDFANIKVAYTLEKRGLEKNIPCCLCQRIDPEEPVIDCLVLSFNKENEAELAKTMFNTSGILVATDYDRYGSNSHFEIRIAACDGLHLAKLERLIMEIHKGRSVSQEKILTAFGSNGKR